MEFQDRTLTCTDCGNSFIFTAGEQSFYQEKGFAHEPRRCKDCRSRKKGDSPGGGGGGRSRGAGGGRGSDSADRQMFSAVCSACGGPAKINFQPDPSRPVFCRTCFQSRQADRSFR